MPRGRMSDQSDWLVDHHQVGVFMNDAQWDIVGLERTLSLGGHRPDLDCLDAAQSMPRQHRLAIDCDRSQRNPALNAGARDIGEYPRKETIKALTEAGASIESKRRLISGVGRSHWIELIGAHSGPLAIIDLSVLH